MCIHSTHATSRNGRAVNFDRIDSTTTRKASQNFHFNDFSAPAYWFHDLQQAYMSSFTIAQCELTIFGICSCHYVCPIIATRVIWIEDTFRRCEEIKLELLFQ